MSGFSDSAINVAFFACEKNMRVSMSDNYMASIEFCNTIFNNLLSRAESPVIATIEQARSDSQQSLMTDEFARGMMNMAKVARAGGRKMAPN